MIGLDSFDKNIISEQSYPKTFAYCQRYREAVTAAAEAEPKPEKIEITEVLKRFAKASFAEPTKQVDSKDPLKLTQGKHVSVAPTDTGFSAQDIGPLLAVSTHEVVVGSKTEDGTEVHIHAPRWNFKVKEVEVNGKSA
jgi:hypothetical protein